MRAPAPIGEAQSRTQASLDPALLTIALLTIATDLELAIGWSIGHNGKLAHVKLDSWTMIFPIRPQDLYTSRIFMARRSLEWLGSAHRADRRIVVIKNHQSHRGVAPSDHRSDSGPPGSPRARSGAMKIMCGRCSVAR